MVVLSLLLGLQPLTTDLYLPALPELTVQLGASLAEGQQTLAALLLAFGVSQPLWGALSDRFGRKSVLATGLALYVMSALGGVLATSIGQLLLWRIVQGVALGASVMTARAIVRDVYETLAAALAMSKALSGLGVLACLGPPLGGLLTWALGWRAALGVLVVIGVLTLAVVLWGLRETLPRPNAEALRWRRFAFTWREIGAHPDFWYFTLLSSASYGGVFTFLATSSYVLIDRYGLTPQDCGWVLCSTAAAFLLGTLLCRRLLRTLGIARTVAFGASASVLGAVGMVTFSGVDHWWAVVLPFYPYMLAHGIHMPCGQSGAVSPFPHAAGSASALAGFVMMLCVFLTGLALGASTLTPRASMTVAISLWALLLAVLGVVSWRRSTKVSAQNSG
ncbi:Bcr/CflA family efflux MFS transporter [Tepidiphilus olei]|uniref:Bcr/CflA family efflux MFS transporter n=1 Tax=Tepidiphilus olei TaxID=2502184 RepID=UPI00163DE2F3|nr:Bcr/CflA family efflux MFS transporter [Tepidiphilus olei]